MILLIVLSCYFMTLLVVLGGWYQSLNDSALVAIRADQVTVLVAFRNEAQNLPALIADLKAQDYPLWEVILIDDHSTDGSLALAEKLTQSDARFRVISLRDGQGKKQAITYGVSLATSHWICTTDADGRLPVAWLSTWQPWLQGDCQLAIGPVYLPEPQSFFQRLQRVEWASLQAVTFATAALGKPVMCNGANLAFTKHVFEQVGGYAGNEHIPSGDDEFLLRKVRGAGFRVAFCNTSSAAVITAYQPTLSSFWHQRIRWAGKWKHNDSLLAKALAVAMLLFQVAYATTLAWWAAGFGPALPLFFLLGAKWLIEAMLLGAVATRHRHRLDLPAFAVWQLMYPFYVVGVGLFSWFAKYRWKGRAIR